MNPLNASNRLQGLKNIIGMVRTNGNPRAVYNQLARQDPQSAQQINQIIQAGRDPKSVALEMLKQQGLDPQEIIDFIGGM